jgi:hypothetical protein
MKQAGARLCRIDQECRGLDAASAGQIRLDDSDSFVQENNVEPDDIVRDSDFDALARLLVQPGPHPIPHGPDVDVSEAGQESTVESLLALAEFHGITPRIEEQRPIRSAICFC